MKNLALVLSENTKKIVLVACLTGFGLTMSAQEYKGTPYTKDGLPHAVPGVIQAEDFDKGGKDITYRCGAAGKGSNKGYRNDTEGGVAISGNGDKIHLSDTSNGDWYLYTLDVKKDGKYTVDIYVATANKPDEPKALSIAFDGEEPYDRQAISTSGWGSFEPMTFENVRLTKGKHVLKLMNHSGSINIDKIEFSK